MIETFPSAATCTACPRHAWASHPGMPTLSLSPCHKPVAILFLGLYPGPEENSSGSFFTGRTGLYFREGFLKASGLLTAASCYATNAARCFAPAKATLPILSKCHNMHTVPDLAAICAAHPRVAVCCMGEGAVSSFIKWACPTQKKKLSVAAAIRRQMESISHPSLSHPVTLFATFNPAMALRSAQARQTFGDHLQLLYRWTTASLPSTVSLTIEAACPPPE